MSTNVEDSGTHPYDPRVKSVVEDSSYSLAFLADMMGRFLDERALERSEPAVTPEDLIYGRLIGAAINI
jgi:hypothetical protein